jgi:hypothetical protein
MQLYQKRLLGAALCRWLHGAQDVYLTQNDTTKLQSDENKLKSDMTELQSEENK